MIEMRLYDQPFYQLLSGEKTVELRLNDEKRRGIAVGDIIRFSRKDQPSERLDMQVVALHKYPSFSKLFQTPLYEKCGCGNLTKEQAVEAMRTYYTSEQEEKWGVLGIEVERFRHGKIFVTGDTHGANDFQKLKLFAKRNPHLTKEDYLIIAGDFGGLWFENTLEEDLRPYCNLPFTVLFVDGNHENFNMLNKYPTKRWNGGKVHFIKKDIIHLTRGQVFELSGKKIFTMGGATSIDKEYRIPNISWWKQEEITYDDIQEAEQNLLRHDNIVDYIITHSCGERALRALHPKLYNRPYKMKTQIDNLFLSKFEQTVDYARWYFGHYHLDTPVGYKCRALYQDIVEIGE